MNKKSRSLFPSHSCEGRNLRRRKAAGNCVSLQFAPSARRFLPSQEWDKSRNGIFCSFLRRV
ncbi:MAG: hypothetical protein ACR2QC_01780 [Gammaproteobacteria bacterium]